MKNKGKFDEIFTALFMLLAIGAIVSYLVLGINNPTYLVLGGLAIALRIAQYIKRFF